MSGSDPRRLPRLPSRARAPRRKERARLRPPPSSSHWTTPNTRLPLPVAPMPPSRTKLADHQQARQSLPTACARVSHTGGSPGAHRSPRTRSPSPGNTHRARRGVCSSLGGGAPRVSGSDPRRLPRLPSTGACATAAATQQRAVLAQSPHPSTRFPKRSPPASRTPAFITLDDPKNSCPPQVRRVDGSGRRRPIGIPARTFLATCGTTALFFCGECKKL